MNIRKQSTESFESIDSFFFYGVSYLSIFKDGNIRIMYVRQKAG